MVLVALCLTIVLGIAVAGYVAVCARTMVLSNRSFCYTSSTQLAETGLEEALWSLNQARNTPGYAWPGWTIANGTATMAPLTGFATNKGVPGVVNVRVGQLRPPVRPSRPTAFADARRIYGALLASVISFIIATLKEPHGKWDAWWIWNFHARFIFRSAEHWRKMFTGALDWTHLDYPLLLPLSIVRSWRYMGGESLYASILPAFLFTFITVGLIWAALSILRGRNQGYLGGLVLMGSPFFIVLGASQFADIPLAFFFLLTFVFIFFMTEFSENDKGSSHPGRSGGRIVGMDKK